MQGQPYPIHTVSRREIRHHLAIMAKQAWRDTGRSLEEWSLGRFTGARLVLPVDSETDWQCFRILERISRKKERLTPPPRFVWVTHGLAMPPKVT